VVAAGTDNGHIELLDLAMGERVAGSRSHPGFFAAPFQFVAGGKLALVTFGEEAVVWNLAEGRKVRVFGEYSDDGDHIVSPDGQSLLLPAFAEKGCQLRLEETLSGKKLWTLGDRYEYLPDAQFSGDGQTIAIFSRYESRQKQSVTFVSAKTGEKIRTFRPHDLEPEPPPEQKVPRYRLLKVSPEMLVATETDDRQRLQLWDPVAGKKLWTWTMPDDCREHLQAVHFVPGGKYVLAEMWGRIEIKECLFVLDAKTGKQLASIPGWDLQDISPNGRFVAYISRDDDRCVVRDLQTGETVLRSEVGGDGRFSADSTVFACAQGFCSFCSGNTPSSIQFYDLQSKQRLGPPRPRPTRIRHMKFAPSGSILAVSYNDSTVILWDARAASR